MFGNLCHMRLGNTIFTGLRCDGVQVTPVNRRSGREQKSMVIGILGTDLNTFPAPQHRYPAFRGFKQTGKRDIQCHAE
ncbi:Uncharacterised protein [Morganella morganii]|nr:Uncharacterised protein [Morganella morganii]